MSTPDPAVRVRDVLDLPKQVKKGDCVQSLTQGVSGALNQLSIPRLSSQHVLRMHRSDISALVRS